MNNFLMVIHVNPVINNFNNNFNTRSNDDDDIENFFHGNIPAVADPNMNIDNCISILGNFEPNKFMNAFIKKIQKIDNDYNFIVASTEELKFRFKILNDDEENNIRLEMTITLYQSNNGHILQFVRNEGTINDFNHYVQMFSGFAKDLLE